MKNTIIPYAKLSKDLKVAFQTWLSRTAPDLISFPFKGKNVSGYIFDHDQQKFLVVTAMQYDDLAIPDMDMQDFGEEF